MCNGKRFGVLRVEFSTCIIEEVMLRFKKKIAINKDIGSV